MSIDSDQRIDWTFVYIKCEFNKQPELIKYIYKHVDDVLVFPPCGNPDHFLCEGGNEEVWKRIENELDITVIPNVIKN